MEVLHYKYCFPYDHHDRLSKHFSFGSLSHLFELLSWSHISKWVYAPISLNDENKRLYGCIHAIKKHTVHGN